MYTNFMTICKFVPAACLTETGSLKKEKQMKGETEQESAKKPLQDKAQTNEEEVHTPVTCLRWSCK